MENTHCPNCKTVLKSSMFSSVRLATALQVQLINEYQENKSDGYCEKCGRLAYSTAYASMKLELSEKTDLLKSLIKSIPVVTTQSPQNWEFDTISMITSQAVLGTSVISDVYTGFADIFGSNSKTLTSVLKSGENYCLNILRKQAIELGANAIIAIDIDYAEVGGSKAMLMVCISGTAVNLKNTVQVLGPEKGNNLNQALELTSRVSHLLQFADLPTTL